MYPIEMISRGQMEHSVIDWHPEIVEDKAPRLKQEIATRPQCTCGTSVEKPEFVRIMSSPRKA
jgi:hypothetical protein